MKYKILVGRTSTKELNIEVEADTLEEAQDKALEEAPQHDFSVGNEICDVSYDLME